MRDRMTRRKKTPQEAREESAQAPLQPAYFDSGKPLPESSARPETDSSESATPQHRQKAASAPATASVQSPESDSAAARTADVQIAGEQSSAPVRRPSRRRRGRGGRGRSGSAPIRPDAQNEVSPLSGTSASPSADVSATQTTQTGILPQPTNAPRTPKGVVVLAIGLPGSGKSSWFKRHHISPLSSDLLRSLLFDDPAEQRFQDLVFSNLRSMLKARLIARRPLNYVDATNLTSHDRRGWIKLAKDYGYEVQGVFFDVPLQVCLERNRRRERTVSEDVMRRMAAKQKPPTFEEGFSKITVVRVKHKE